MLAISHGVAVGPLRADEPEADSASPTPAEQAFLALPAYDLERIGAANKLMVGDSLELRVGGLVGITGPAG